MRVRFLLVLQYVVGANSSYTSSCLMSLSRCSSKEDAATSQKICKKIQIVGEGETVLIDYYTPVSQTILKQLQMQPFKHPCTLWGIYLSNTVLPWQTSSFQNRSFTYKLQFSFKARHYFFQGRVFIQNIKQSSKHAAFLSVEMWPFFLSS